LIKKEGDMMTIEDEILLENNFPYENMTIEERNRCLDILRHTKEISESEFLFNSNSESKYDIIFMNLYKEDGVHKFNGAVGNNSENRYIDGHIAFVGETIYVKTNITRLHELLSDDEKDITVFDVFVRKEDTLIRRTSYMNNRFYESYLEPFSNEEMDTYLTMKLNEYKIKLQ